MIADTWLLLLLQRRLAWNSFRARSPARQALLALGALWLGGFGVFGSATVGAGLGELLGQYPELGLEPLLPGLLLTVAMLLLLFTSFGTALGSLFLANDLELLMAAPVDTRAVFISKILGSLDLDYAILLVVAAPGLLTYGLELGYGPGYYGLALLALLGAPLLPAGLGALLVMLVARFAPARRVREVLGLAAGLTGLACSALGQTTRLWTRRLGETGADLRALLAAVQSLANLPAPSLVAGRGLAAAGRGDPLGAAADLAGYLALTFGFFAATVWAAERLYTAGWVRMQSSGAAGRIGPRAKRAGWLGRAPAGLAIALKDWRVIPRDLRNFAQMLWPLLVLPMVYVNLIASGHRGGRTLDALDRAGGRALDLTGVYIAAGILLATSLIFSRMALTSISMEGRSWWLLKAAPLSGIELLGGKYLAVWIPFSLLSSALLAGAAVWRGFGPVGVLYGWFGLELLGSGILAVAVGFAVPWARLDWDDPRRMGSGWGALFSALGSATIAVLGGGLLCLPVIAEADWPALLPAAWLIGPLAAAIVTGALAAAAISFGLSRLPQVGE